MFYSMFTGTTVDQYMRQIPNMLGNELWVEIYEHQLECLFCL